MDYEKKVSIMHSRRMICGSLFMVAVLLAAPDARAGSIAWDKIIGVDLIKLSPDQKKTVASNLERLANTRGCKGTLAQCLAKGDLTARRHAGFVVRMVQKGKSITMIEKGVQLRKASAYPDETFEIDLLDHPHNGNPKARVVVVEYACFQCPFCAHLAPKIKNLKKRFGQKVVHYYKFFPVRSHPRGVPTALAGLAAFRQNRFWQMYDLMFENRADLDDPDLLQYAQKSGIDIPAFQAAIKDPKSMRYIEKDKLEGMRFGVDGTPTFFINGKMYQGLADYAEIIDRIAEEIEIVEGLIL